MAELRFRRFPGELTKSEFQRTHPR